MKPANGKFQEGQSGNPGGRPPSVLQREPKTLEDIEALREIVYEKRSSLKNQRRAMKLLRYFEGQKRSLFSRAVGSSRRRAHTLLHDPNAREMH